MAKRAFCNKLILVPAALETSALAPWAITPLLLAGDGQTGQSKPGRINRISPAKAAPDWQ